MKRFVTIMALAALLAGCANTKDKGCKSVRLMSPGYGLVLAAFEYVPGKSRFPREQVLYDAKYAQTSLAGLGYDSFIAYSGGNSARVGIRLPTKASAERMLVQLRSRGSINLGDGQSLKLTDPRIMNISELQKNALEIIP